MGLFNRKKKKQREFTDEELDYLANNIVNMTFGAPMSPEEKAGLERREKLAEEGRRERERRIASLGVDVELFTKAKIEEDAIRFLDLCSPHWRLFKLKEKSASCDFQNLTKTGKLPKNVCVAQFNFSGLPEGRHTSIDSVIVNLKYLQDGSVNMADIHLWHSGEGISYTVRRNEESYRITSIVRIDIDRDLRTTVYVEGTNDDDPILVLDREIRNWDLQ